MEMSSFSYYYIFFIIFFFMLLLLADTSLHLQQSDFPASMTSSHNRRALHQPFFPSTSSSASLPPAQPPSPSFPKYPSSSTSTFHPFFPLYPSPPPPPTPPASPATTSTTSLPTFPANISSVDSSSSRHYHSRLVPAFAFPLLALVLLGLSVSLFLLHRRRHRGGGDKDARSDSLRFFPPDTTASDGRKLSPTPASGAPAGSEFLYLGTLVNSRDRSSESSSGAQQGAAASGGSGSPYRKLGSPELRPLPPLPRQFHNAEAGGRTSSDEEEYYSPKDSNGAKGTASIGPVANSKRTSFAGEMERSASRSSTLSTPSYLSSNVVSSPTRSSPTTSSPPLPPPVPPPLLRPPTPSPPKRRPRSHSPPSSPPEVDGEPKMGALQVSGGRNSWSPKKIGDFARNTFPISRNPPPPPPPPPIAGYREKVPPLKPPLKPPVLIPPKPVGMRNSLATVFPAESPKNSDAAAEHCEENSRPKLKPLHWDKVRASSDRAMVWDQLRSGSFQLNEEMIEQLFVYNSTKTVAKEAVGSQVNASLNQETRVLDPKKSQNIAILLRALNVTKEEVCEALLEGNADRLGSEVLEALTKMVPSKEEELKLKQYTDHSPFKLGPAESFLKAVLDIPFAFKRVNAMLYLVNFDPEVDHLKNLFGTLEAACEEMRNNRMFRKILAAVLKTGNRMNVGTNRGDAHAFKLDTLLKLVDIKGTDGKTTLLHFVIQEIIRSEGLRLSANSCAAATPTNALADLECRRIGLLVVSALGSELTNVKKAAAMDSDVLGSCVARLAAGVQKVQELLRLNSSFANKNGQKFHDSMMVFLEKAEDKILEIQDRESFALSLVKETTEYFHGDSAKEEAHPFRIFVVVRDFLAILDQVCKEVEKINEHALSSAAHRLPVLANPSSFSAFPSFNAVRPGFSDDESSSSS